MWPVDLIQAFHKYIHLLRPTVCQALSGTCDDDNDGTNMVHLKEARYARIQTYATSNLSVFNSSIVNYLVP